MGVLQPLAHQEGGLSDEGGPGTGPSRPESAVCASMSFGSAKRRATSAARKKRWLDAQVLSAQNGAMDERSVGRHA